MAGRKPIIRFLDLLVGAYGLHAILHALVECCYRQAKLRYEDHDLALNWQTMGAALTALEVVALKMKTDARDRETHRREARAIARMLGPGR